MRENPDFDILKGHDELIKTFKEMETKKGEYEEIRSKMYGFPFRILAINLNFRSIGHQFMNVCAKYLNEHPMYPNKKIVGTAYIFDHKNNK